MLVQSEQAVKRESGMSFKVAKKSCNSNMQCMVRLLLLSCFINRLHWVLFYEEARIAKYSERQTYQEQCASIHRRFLKAQ